MLSTYQAQQSEPNDAPTLPLRMETFNFVGQRADKILVTDVLGPRTYTDSSGMEQEGIAKEVEHYTLTCPDCGGDGYYDEIGDVICERCGVVISDDHDPVVPYEYGGSRGFSEPDKPAPGHREPA